MLAFSVSLLSRWRLLLDPPAPGARNLAIDEALLVRAASPGARPILRCYSWAPCCLSLGRFQSTAGLNRAGAAELGIDLARRPTGGRAIVHDDELTYAVVAPAGHALTALSIRDSYRLLATALQAAVCLIGGATEPAARSRRRALHDQPGRRLDRQDCFATPSDYEILADGRKLIGSAQVRRDGALLQHGSILLDRYLSPDLLFGRAEFGPPPATLRSLLGRAVAPDELIEALVIAFQQTYGIGLEPDVLSNDEEQLAEQLTKIKYSNEDWTFAR